MASTRSSVEQRSAHSTIARPDDHDIAALVTTLQANIEGEIRFGRHDRMLYATDASMYQVEPLGVVIPRTINDAAAAARICIEHHVPILPRGGGTSLAGQAVNRAVVIDFSASCNRLLDIDPATRTARVEPGVVLDTLNRAASAHGLMFGPDVATAAHANIGGMIGNNSAGAHSILYGRTIDHVQSLVVLLADGSRHHLGIHAAQHDKAVAQLTQQLADVIYPIQTHIRARFPHIVRKTNGYPLDVMLQQLEQSHRGTFDHVNLASLMCGSEGTLAMTLEATLKLVEAPPRLALALVAFESVDAALRAVPFILQTQPSAVELIDDVVIAAAGNNLEYCRYVDLLPTLSGSVPAAVVYVEYFARDDADIARHHADLVEVVGPSRPMQLHASQADMTSAWKLRRAGEPLLCALPGDRKPLTFIEDTAVDPATLAAFVSDFRAMVERHGTTAAYYAHASVGCLHIRPMIDLRSLDDRRRMTEIMAEACDLVMQYGGAISAEHGIGRLRSNSMERYFGREIAQAFRHIKHIFDPANMLNPGMMVEPQAPDVHLRIEPMVHSPVRVPAVDTYFHYDCGFAEAVEACNGSGVCRKTVGGTMCPSYRATRDERHATRGRGNALRLAITGQFSSDRSVPLWNDPETMKTLDLCLSCKACKTECPSNVDIAKLKAEYLAQRNRQLGRPPLHARMLGRVRQINALGSRVHTISNALVRLRIARMLINQMMNIDTRRSLPPFGPSLYRWHRSRRGVRSDNGHAPTVILFPDCFTTYNEPHIGRAAIRALNALGYRVLLPRLACCGRAMISTGQLEAARGIVRRCALALLRAIDECAATAVVGCEPSCISAIKDDWLDLKIDLPRASLRELARRTMLIEQFIDARWNAHPVAPAIKHPLSQPAILHGHCHQKSLWGIDSSAALLRRLFGDSLTVLENGCCGMAGGFGLSPNHFDLSRQIYDLELGHAIRAHPGATIIATGTSCRHQIHDFAKRRSVHPIELVSEVLCDR